MQKLNTTHRIVARELALGVKLDKICESRGLNLRSWKQITLAPLFQEEVLRIGQEIEKKLIDDHCADPVLVKLHTEALASLDRVIRERDNFEPEQGATANTRLSASKTLLEYAGYGQKEESGGNTVVINLSPAKLASIQEKRKTYEGDFSEENLKELAG